MKRSALLAGFAFYLTTCCGQAILGQDYSDQLPRIPASSPEQAARQFHVQQGFEIQLVAAEPDVASPVEIQWDAGGHLFVCEMRGYSEQRADGISRIRVLEDLDQDGVYEHSRVFFEGLKWPTAIFPYKGGLFVADAPDILYLTDRDKDGVADHSQVVLTGFGTSNVQGLLNSFRWGLDQRIHVACSSVGGKVRRPQDPVDSAVDIRGHDLAFDPETFEFRTMGGAGQHGMGFDDWGRKFTCSNSDHIQQVVYDDRYVAGKPFVLAPPVRRSIAADGPQAEVFRSSPIEPWRILRTRLRVRGQVPGPIEGGGRPAGYFTGATGVTIYRGDAWPTQWRGVAIVGDVGSNLIHRKRLTPAGLFMKAERIDPESEFITSDDIWFRPAQFSNGPDGNLYVVDVCREVIEHPKSLPPGIKEHLDLTAGRDRGRIYRVARSNYVYQPPRWLDDRPLSEWVAFLDHPNAWHRETASRLLWENRLLSNPDGLREGVKQFSTAQGRLHSLALLKAMQELDVDTLLLALHDKHPMVRRLAIQATEDVSDSKIRQLCLEMADDPSIEVRCQLAFSLSYFDSTGKTPCLLKILKQNPDDTYITSAIHSALGNESESFLNEIMADPRLFAQLEPTFRDSLFRQVAHENPEVLLIYLNQSEKLRSDPILGLTIAGLLNAASDTNESRNRLGAAEERIGIALRDSILQTSFLAAEIVSDSDETLENRIRAIKALRFGNLSDVRKLAESIWNRQSALELQEQVLETLSSFSGAEVSSLVLERWEQFGPSMRRKTVRLLMSRTVWTHALLDAVEQGEITAAEMGRQELQLLTKSREPALQKRAGTLLAKMQNTDRLAVMEKYQAALKGSGDSASGKEVFLQRCASCHQWKGEGNVLGPNLANVAQRGAETILSNVLDPNREVNPEYLNYLVRTRDGRILTGMISNEGSSSLTLKDGTNPPRIVSRAEIEELQSTGMSLMPEGLENDISVDEMRDLLNFLLDSP